MNKQVGPREFDEEALSELQEELNKAFEMAAKEMQTGNFQRDLEAYKKRQAKSKKIRAWIGYVWFTLAIFGLIFLPQVMLPINLLKVGLFCLWLALGLFLNR